MCLPRKSSEIFGHFRKFSENVQECSSGLRDNLRKSSESGRKSSENNQKRCYRYVYIIKRTLHVSSKIWILCFVARAISHSFAALTREILFSPLENKIHIFSPPCNILYTSHKSLVFSGMHTRLKACVCSTTRHGIAMFRGVNRVLIIYRDVHV